MTQTRFTGLTILNAQCNKGFSKEESFEWSLILKFPPPDDA